MARVFEDIKLEWAGRTYTIRANRVMGAIARIEDVVTLAELGRYGEKQTAPLGKIAMAYGTVLRYAGAQVDDDEVYEGMFSAGDTQQAIIASVQTLMAMMVPPSAIASATEGNSLGNGQPTAARSSRKRTRQRSVHGA